MVEVEFVGVVLYVVQWENVRGVRRSVWINNISLRVESISNARLFIESEINKGTKATIKFPNRGGVEHRQ